MDWQLGGLIVGALAVVYGFVVAFGLKNQPQGTKTKIVNIGAVVLLLAGIFLFLLPLLEVY